MDPRDFYQIATSLATSQKPGERRTAVGRAYYAAYNVAATFLRDLKVTIEKKPESHKKVQEFLSNSGDKEITEIAHKLETMRTMRNHADYDLDNPTPENPQKVEINIALAKNFIKAIDKCSSENKRLAVVETNVQKWREENGYL
jgi:uncharacterized protein (UPF0332 family)